MRHKLELRWLVCIALVALPPAVAAPPPDAFCVIVIEGADGFRLVRITVDEETNLTERKQLFSAVDADRDGAVTPSEAEAFRVGNLALRPTAQGLGVRGVFLEPVPATDPPAVLPLYGATWRQLGHTFHKTSYSMPVPLGDPSILETQEVREFSFTVDGDPTRVRLKGGLAAYPALNATRPVQVEQPRAVIEYVVVRAPPGWLVEHVKGTDYTGTFVQHVNAAEVDLPAFDTKSPYEIQFVNPEAVERAKSKGGPGLELAGTMLALAAVGLLSRKSRP